jgi:hypothetical protein
MQVIMTSLKFCIYVQNLIKFTLVRTKVIQILLLFKIYLVKLQTLSFGNLSPKAFL